MSAPVVVIGFIFLIPSILGMIASALMLCGSVISSGMEANRIRNEARAQMQNDGVPESVIAATLEGKEVPLESLEERTSVRFAEDKLRTINVANGFGLLFDGWFIAAGIASFVGGLLGWLLVMKKRVLQCSVCGAVVNAS